MEHHITLPGDGTDFTHWRQVARALLLAQVPPEAVSWHTTSAQQTAPDLFAAAMTDVAAAPPPASVPLPPVLPASTPWVVPRWWMALAEQCLLHASADRFGLLYRMLWRLQQEPGLRHDPLDADRVSLQHKVKAVRREVHKMHAFVRFRPVPLAPDPLDGDGPLHVAWFEPQHFITQAAAPFFVHRFANMRWAILTPHCSLRWWPQAPDVQALAGQGVQPHQAIQPLRGRPGVLSCGPGAQASDAPAADAGEQLWLTYYAHIFNPARLKVQAMTREMPRRYWHNLPEAQLISPLIQAASARSAAMLAQPAAPVRRRVPPQRPPRAVPPEA